LRIAQTQSGYAHLIAGHFFQRAVGVQHDVAAFHFIHQTFDQNFLRAEGVATVNQVHFRCDIRQIQRFFNSGVAAADHRNFLVTVEETVAGRAGETPRPLNASSEGRPR
jgi:hypothetical protein